MKVSAFLAMAALLAFWPFSGSSSKTYHLMPGQMVPAASGTVKVTKDKTNGNLDLDIKVQNLALPGSLNPPENDYVVWLEPHGRDPVKQGAIGIDGSKLQGELKTQTTASNFNILITAEKNET
ncbi:MAG: hypothetical protein ACRD3O_21520, partial [Terriglobia bacterium]